MLAIDFAGIPEHLRVVTKAMVAELRQRAPEGVERVGISVLGNVQEAYNAKARHGTGSDGVRWDELQRATLEARVRRRAAARKIVEQRRQLAQEIRGIQSGGITPRARKGKGKAVDPDVAVAQLRAKQAALSAKLQALVDKEVASHEIGVDTGLQINSASPGLPGDSIWHRKPTDSLGANVFVVTAGTVTIGYDRAYSEAFDKHRSLIPATLPDPWRTEAEGALMTWADLVLREALN